MPRIFTMKLDKVQPSQLYISQEKLSQVMKTVNPNKPAPIEPIPIKKLGNQVIFVDGHTRAFAAFLQGLSEVPVYWETDELDWDAYRICIQWCMQAHIHIIADLKNRVVSSKDYEVLWLQRCEKMQQELEAKRRNKK